jgi:DNA mismatch repair protein MutL
MSQTGSIIAYISGAGKSAKSRKTQVFFVNGRYVKDSVLSDAVAAAYKEYMPEGRYPTVFLFLNVDPAAVDVNVHPAKSEIRFYEPAKITELVRSALRTALVSKAGIPKAATQQQRVAAKKAERAFYSLSEDATDAADAIKDIGAADSDGIDGADGFNGADRTDASESTVTNKLEYIGGTEGDYAQLVNIQKLWTTNQDKTDNNVQSEQNLQMVAEETIDAYDASENADVVTAGETAPNANINNSILLNSANTAANGAQQELAIDYLTLLGAAFGTYQLATDADSLYLIDQHAAHERINYELLLTNMKNGAHESQTLLSPYIIQISAPLVPFMEERADVLQKLGFETDVFGGASVIIRSFPTFLTAGEAEVFAVDVIESDAKDDLVSDTALERLIARACRKSIKANEPLEPEEAKALLTALAACDNPYTCPHGRPVFIRLTKYDIEKMFGRV